ncbi:MAG: hypothetical protein KDB00_23935 [Planctomycetales bacterium]|nr:hypothetical protein [Planctomycetales bacterium]
MTSTNDDHADKYNDPRARISRRGVLIGVLVLVFGIIGSALSIWARRTHLVRSTEFWGPDVILAFQLAEEVELISFNNSDPAEPESGGASPASDELMPAADELMPAADELMPAADELMPAKPESDGEPADGQVVRLSGMPGLGHLRHVLLDERSYVWESVQNGSLTADSKSPEWMILRFRDPTAGRFPDANIAVDLAGGWIGLEGGTKKVQLNERFRNALPNFLIQIANFEPTRVEMREKKEAGG